MNKLKKLEEIYEEANKNVRMACFDELKKIGKELKALGWDGKPLYPFSKEACREEYKNDIEAALGDISENEDDYENKYAEVFESYWYDYVDGYTVLFMNHDYYSYCGFEFVINEYGEIFCTKASPHSGDFDIDNPYDNAYEYLDIDKTDISTTTYLIERAWQKINQLKQEMSNQKD